MKQIMRPMKPFEQATVSIGIQMGMASTLMSIGDILMTMTEVNIQNCAFSNYIERMYNGCQASDTLSLGLIEQFNMI